MNKRTIAAAGAAAAALAVGGVVANETLLDATAAATISPGQSWQAAYTAAAAGDVLNVAAGNHPAVTLTNTNKAVVFDCAPGAVVTGDFTSGASQQATGAKGWELRDCKVNGLSGVVLRPGSVNVILRNVDASRFHVESKGGRGTASFSGDVQILGGDWGPSVEKTATINGFGVEDVVIDGAHFHDYSVTDPATHNECMQIWPSGGKRITVRNSLFRNCTDFGVLIKAPDSSGFLWEGNRMEMPMPGNQNTTACGSSCPRSGNSLRFSSYLYPGSIVRNNRFGGGFSNSDPAGVQNINNAINTGETWPAPSGSPPPPPPPPPPDTTPPVLSLPGDITKPATSSSGAVVTYSVSASDNVDPSPSVSCSPISGSTFPIGTTTVVCSATDDAGNIANGQFFVTVEPLPPPPPPDDPDRDIFCNEYVPNTQAESNYAKWLTQNPGEKTRWEAYRDAVCAGQNPAPPAMTTAKGRGLVAAGKMAVN